MLRLILNAHPAIAVPDEQSYFQFFPEAACTWEAPNWTADEYETRVRTYLNARLPTLPGLEVEAVLAALTAPDTERTLRSPLQETMTAWMRSQGKRRWGEKTPINFFYVDVLDAMFPEAQYLHLVRDPRAVVHSMNRFARCVDDTVVNAVNWRTFIEEGAGLLERTVPAARRHTLSYEALTADPERTVRRICAFLGEPFAPEMLDFHRQAGEYMHPAYERLGGINTVTRPVTRTATPKWRTGLAADDVAVIESVCERGMQRYGYARSGHRPSWRARANLYLKSAYVAAKAFQHRRHRVHLVNYKPFSRLRAALGGSLRRRRLAR